MAAATSQRAKAMRPAILVGLIALIAGGVFSLATSASAETHVVEMRGFEFFPAEVNAAVGDTIVWINKDVVPHTATAADGAWDSGLMETDDEFSLTIEADTSAGDYVCTFHPNMVGAISVE
jgi:plastocyanin